MPSVRRPRTWLGHGAALAVSAFLLALQAGCTDGAEAGTTPTEPPATELDPAVVQAFDRAAHDAADAGVELAIASGWRSAADQEALYDQALQRHGSAKEAQRWVLPPEHSAHVQGLAIDVGPTEGVYWLAERAEEYGLCQTYANEPWHFELLADVDSCPTPHQDASWGWN